MSRLALPIRPLLLFVLSVASGVAFAEEPRAGVADVPLRCRLIGEFPLGEGATFAWVGGSWVERMQEHDDLELCLTVRWHAARPTFRNLGWGGDTVRGESRAVFGAPDDGYGRLISDLDVAAPDVVLLAYGANEAFDGAMGKAGFLERYERLIDDMTGKERKVVLVTPPPMEPTTATRARVEAYNLELAEYAIAIVELAERRNLPILETTLATLDALPPEPPANPTWTVEGQKLTRDAYLALGQAIADAVSGAGEWQVEADLPSGKGEATATASGSEIVRIASLEGGGIDVTLRDATLPLPAAPLGEASSAAVDAGTIKVSGLASGRYGLAIGASSLATGSADEWDQGVEFRRSYATVTLQALQATIQHKNWLFFQRHRPQNETYLFLFRKHEQGNNAAEIPQFDPLIAAAEQAIAKLATPGETKLTIKPAK